MAQTALVRRSRKAAANHALVPPTAKLNRRRALAQILVYTAKPFRQFFLRSRKVFGNTNINEIAVGAKTIEAASDHLRQDVLFEREVASHFWDLTEDVPAKEIDARAY